MATITFRERGSERVLYAGDHADDAAALTHCAANGVDLTRVDLSNRSFEGADISGLWAPYADLRGATLRNVRADRLVNGRTCELSASLLQGARISSAAFTHANLSCCGAPAAFRVEPGPNLRLRGVDWSQCPDVIELPVAKRERDRVGRVLAVRNGTGWKVHAGTRGVMTEATARTTLAAVPEYAETLAYLDSAECTQRKSEIEARPAGETRLEEGVRVR